MEQAVQIFAVIALIGVGLSHVIYPQGWVSFFLELRARGPAGAIINGLMSLWFGGIIVGFHRVWEGIPLVLTLLGVAQCLKGILNLAWPGHGVKMLSHPRVEKHVGYQVAGIVFLILAALLIYHLYRARQPVSI
jgi:hypothetical protein